MRANQRSAVAFLLDVYGIAARVEHKGTKHPRLKFTHKGKEHCVSIAGSPSDSYRGPRNMEKQLRDMLGAPPPPPPAREPRRLEAMLPGPGPIVAPPPQNETFMGTMAHYTAGTVRFFPPIEIAAVFGDDSVYVTRPGRVKWEIRRKPDQRDTTPKIRRDGASGYRLQASYAGDPLPLFCNKSPAEYAVIGNKVVVTLFEDRLEPVQPRKVPVAAPPVAAPPVAAPPVAAPPSTRETVKERGQRILREIDDFEEDEGYHLTKDKTTGRRVFAPKAAIIKLED